MDAELPLGRRHVELLDEDPRQLVVVVLAGVDEHLVVSLAQTARDGGRLHELGPVANDGEYPHVLEDCGRGMTQLVDNVRGTVSAAVGASRHLLWYFGYQIGSSGPKDPR